MFNEDSDVVNNLVYKTINYYDTDEFVELLKFDKDGKIENDDNIVSEDTVSDIEKWFSYTPIISFYSEELMNNSQVHDTIIVSLKKIYSICDSYDEEYVSDDWENSGEIQVNHSISFCNSKVNEIVELLQQTVDVFKIDGTADVNIFISAVADGENDYPYASIEIYLENGILKCRYHRI